MDQPAREALQHLIASEHRLFEQMRHQEQLAERWQTRAELAVRRSEDQLASEALVRKTQHEQRARELRTQYLAHGDAVRQAKLKLAGVAGPARKTSSLPPEPGNSSGAGSQPPRPDISGAGFQPAGGQDARSTAEVKLDQLAREDRLERDLQELKQRLAAAS